MTEPQFEDAEDFQDIKVQIGGDSIAQLPNDLFVPEDALYVSLDTFEGPLDLLLYLIRKHQLNILDFSVAEITTQYMSYLDVMTAMNLRIAGEYLVMAATLMMIKSKALLPQLEVEEEDEDDATHALRQRLLAYQQLKEAAEGLNDLPRMERDTHSAQIPIVEVVTEEQLPDVGLSEIVVAFAELMTRVKLTQQHEVPRPVISVRERMGEMLATLESINDYVPFESLFKIEEGKPSVIASLLALLELLRSNVIKVTQPHSFAPILVKIDSTEKDE